MKISTTVTAISSEQPDAEAWNRLQQFAATWNQRHQHRFRQSLGLFLDVTFDEAAHPELAELRVSLERLRSAHQVEIHIVQERSYDEADYANADFVEINGVALDEQTGRELALNAHEVLTPDPCPTCGFETMFDQAQSAPFMIDYTRLEAPSVQGVAAPPRGWDFIDTQAGLKLVSSRFADVLLGLGIRGYTLEPVLSNTKGDVSKRAWQLRADRAILVPCPVHTPPVDGYFCPTCGAAHCDVEEEDSVRDDVVGNDEIFARHRQRGAIIYVSGRVYHALRAADLHDIKPSRIFHECHHLERRAQPPESAAEEARHSIPFRSRHLL